MSKDVFKLGDFVRTKKGAQFWGTIIAFDNDEESPGCTVLAIAPGFEGTKHVYPLAQLELRMFMETDRQYGTPDGIVIMGVGDGSGRLFIYGSHDAINRVRGWMSVTEAAVRLIRHSDYEYGLMDLHNAINRVHDMSVDHDKTT